MSDKKAKAKTRLINILKSEADNAKIKVATNPNVNETHKPLVFGEITLDLNKKIKAVNAI